MSYSRIAISITALAALMLLPPVVRASWSDLQVQFEFLAVPDVTFVGSERTMDLCLVNRGQDVELSRGSFFDFHKIVIALPVGPMDDDLTEFPEVLSCMAMKPEWQCVGPRIGEGVARLTLRPKKKAHVQAGETICFRVQGLMVNTRVGLVVLEVDLQTGRHRERLLPMTVFKAELAPIRHDDLGDVSPEQHHLRYTGDEAFDAVADRDGHGCGLDADTVDGIHANDLGGGLWSASGDDIYFLRAGVDAKVGIGTADPRRTLDVNGDTRVAGVLELYGGADVAEPFDFDIAHDIRPGMVVSIDPDHEGLLRLASSPYDRTVAGVVSGANGVEPGLTLRMTGGSLDGSHPVALTGRVWAWCDADAAGPIAAGDLLTTSGTPGHAMRVRDHDLARGAILGKAMSSLESGRGQVLILVTLQ